jgi:hypothetical protein
MRVFQKYITWSLSKFNHQWLKNFSHHPIIKFFWMATQTHFWVAICKVIETLFWSLMIVIFFCWQLNIWSPTNVIFCHLQLKSRLPLIVVHRVQQELSKNILQATFPNWVASDQIFFDHYPTIKFSWIMTKDHF